MIAVPRRWAKVRPEQAYPVLPVSMGLQNWIICMRPLVKPTGIFSHTDSALCAV
jgi:hypothetical protein